MTIKERLEFLQEHSHHVQDFRDAGGSEEQAKSLAACMILDAESNQTKIGLN